MVANPTTTSFAKLDCCPQLEPCDACDRLDIRYRLPFRPVVAVGAQGRGVVPVEVTLRFQLERCPGSLALGDITYSTTLFPGEKVRLFSSDRRTRFTFDSDNKLAYRNEATSEESDYTMGMAQAMSDLSIVQNVSKTSTSHESSVGGGVNGGINLFGLVEIGGGVSASSYDAKSTSQLASQLSQHAEASSKHVEVGVRATSATSVGEVESRTHTQTESEDHFESASRTFANPNRCHAITFFFYRINKCQTVKFTLVGIDRRVDDPAAPTGVIRNPPVRSGEVSVIRQGTLATANNRLEVERQAQASVLEGFANADAQRSAQGVGFRSAAIGLFASQEPISAGVQAAALDLVDRRLVAEGLITAVGGDVTPVAQKKYSWERTIVLPTPGVIVKGCLDECDICEPALAEEIKLELARKSLENDLLTRQIALLEKSQEYRCCPVGETEEPGTP